MKRLLRISALWLGAVVCGAQPPAAHAAPPPAPLRFTIFAPGESKESVVLLSRVLGAGQSAKVQVASDFQAAIEAPADVLVLWMDFDVRPFFFSPLAKRTLTAAQFEPFRKKKVIGIGFGAGMLFNALGVKAYYQTCAIGSEKMEIAVKRNGLCPEFQGRKLSSYTQDGEVAFGFYHPEEEPGIEEIARHASVGPNGQPNTDYAALVKDGNFILTGLAAPTTVWSQDYQTFFGKLAAAMARAPLGPFTGHASVPASPVPSQVPGMGETVQNKAGDWLKVVALQPSAGATLPGGEKVWLTIQYNVASGKPVRIWAEGDGAGNYAPSPELTEPRGEVDRFIVSEEPCWNNKIIISLVDAATRQNLVRLVLNVTHQWNSYQPGSEPVAVVGKPLPALQFTSTSGQAVDLAGMKGKVVLIDFWATWCGPCKREMPRVLEAYSACKKDGFEIVGISLDEDQAAMEEYCREQKIPWPQYCDGKAWQNAIARQFHVSSIPHCILLDREGIVRKVGAPDEELAQVIQNLCAQKTK